VRALALNPRDTSIIYAGTNEGVFWSASGGDSWKQVNTGLTDVDVRSLAISPATPEVLFAGTLSGVYRSDTSGDTWVLAKSVVFNEEEELTALVIDPHSSLTVYALLFCSGLYKSIDGGLHWEQANFPGCIRALLVDPNEHGTIYAGC
jgi:photosystem II stability/assembly factor-like uncharacterized protein